MTARLSLAAGPDAFGCDSCDGTYLAFAPDRLLPDVLSWSAQGALW